MIRLEAAARAIVKVRAGLEEVNELIETQLECALLGARVNGLLGELALLVLKVDDALFDCVCDGELVDDHVYGLIEAMDAIDGLFLDELYDKTD